MSCPCTDPTFESSTIIGADSTSREARLSQFERLTSNEVGSQASLCSIDETSEQLERRG